MAKSMNNQELSSKRHFHWTSKVSNNEDEATTASFKSLNIVHQEIKQKNEAAESSSKPPSTEKKGCHREERAAAAYSSSKKLQAVAVSRLRSVLTAFGKNRQPLQQRVVLGTLFGNKRGHVHFAFQKDPKLQPALLIQLATPITGLVREMASGLVRIALESEKKGKRGSVPLLEEPVWRTYCNGIKCGLATRVECGGKEWKILKAVEPISMGAGVLPESEGEEEVIYMRAKFERVVGSTDSEALYMVNPDNNAAPELSIYLLRF
ncbi:hypothetical protein Pfo_020447 [Paulownia fortunei]|nr:hypothetical protein Pfo_020447 [Paulownia fortunei]